MGFIMQLILWFQMKAEGLKEVCKEIAQLCIILNPWSPGVERNKGFLYTI